MNIQEALIAARNANKAIKRKEWLNTCIYHGTDNLLRWHIQEYHTINEKVCTLSIDLLLAEDWEITGMTAYHGYLEKLNFRK